MTESFRAHPDDSALAAVALGRATSQVRFAVARHLEGGCCACQAFLDAFAEQGVHDPGDPQRLHVPATLLEAAVRDRGSLSALAIEMIDLHLDTCPDCRQRHTALQEAESPVRVEAPASGVVLPVRVEAESLRGIAAAFVDALLAAGVTPQILPAPTMGDAEAPATPRVMPFRLGPRGLAERALAALEQPHGVRWELRTGESIRIRLDVTRAAVTLDDAVFADGSPAHSLRAVRRPASGSTAAASQVIASSRRGALTMPLEEFQGAFEIELTP